MNVFDLVATISLNKKAYENDLREASGETESFGERLGASFEKAVAIGVTALTALGTATIGFINKTAGAGDAIDKNSQKIGMSYEAYQKWDYAMKIAGTSMEQSQMGLKTLTNKFDDALNGSESAAESFTRLGLSVNDLKGLSREEIFERVIYSLQNVSDETEKAALANDLLGRAGMNLMPMLNGTNEELQGLFQTAEEYGFVMSDDMVKASATYQDSLLTLKSTMGGLRNEIFGRFLPVISDMFDNVAKKIRDFMADENNAKMISDALKGALNFVTGALKVLGKIAGAVIKVISKLSKFLNEHKNVAKALKGVLIALVSAFAGFVIIKKVIGFVKKLTGALGNGADALGGVIKWLMANPIVALIAALAAVGVAITGVILKATELRRAYKKASKARQEQIQDTQVEAEKNRMLADELVTLSEKENKSAEDKAKLKQLVEQLNGRVDGLNLTYDENTGQLNKNSEEIYKNIDANNDQLIAKAYAAQAEDLINEKIKDQMKLEDLRAEKKALLAEAEKTTDEQRLAEIGQRISDIDMQESQLLQNQTDREAEYETLMRRASGELGTLGSDFQNLAKQAEEAGIQIPEELKTAIDEGSVEVPKSLNELKALCEPEYRELVMLANEAGIDIPEEISTGIDNGTVTATDATQKLRNAIIAKWKENPEKFPEVGKWMTSGVADGTIAPEVMDKLVRNAGKVVDEFIKAANKKADSHSPSRVTRDKVGKWLGLGVAEGIMSSLPEVKRTAEAFMDEISNTMSDNVGVNYSVASGLPSVSMDSVYGSESGYNGDITQNVYITAPAELSPSETARLTKNATRNLVLSLRSV